MENYTITYLLISGIISTFLMILEGIYLDYYANLQDRQQFIKRAINYYIFYFIFWPVVLLLFGVTTIIHLVKEK